MTPNTQKVEFFDGITYEWKLETTGSNLWLQFYFPTGQGHFVRSNFFHLDTVPEDLLISIMRKQANFDHPFLTSRKAELLQTALRDAMAIRDIIPALESVTPAAVPEKVVAA